jgi:hypothetical protein
MGKKKERVVENAWPSDRTVTTPVDFPERLTVRVDAGDLTAVHDRMCAAIRAIEEGEPGTAFKHLVAVTSDDYLERMIHQPLDEVLPGILSEGVTDEDRGALLTKLARNSMFSLPGPVLLELRAPDSYVADAEEAFANGVAVGMGL